MIIITAAVIFRSSPYRFHFFFTFSFFFHIISPLRDPVAGYDCPIVSLLPLSSFIIIQSPSSSVSVSETLIAHGTRYRSPQHQHAAELDANRCVLAARETLTMALTLFCSMDYFDYDRFGCRHTLLDRRVFLFVCVCVCVRVYLCV